VRKDASGDIHVGLDSSTPCWNDGIEVLELTEAPSPGISKECFISLRSPTEHENAKLRHAGMDGRHPGAQDASGNIHVGLDSSTPCWNDGIEESYQD
jgi:hypothetical protein